MILQEALTSEVIHPRPALHRRSFIRETIETLVLIGAIYALVNLASVRFIVEGPSMQPNFHTGQVLVVSRVNYLLGDPQRGQIVVFNPPGQSSDLPPYIKRVIGLPGETVEIREMKVYINGQELQEPYINEPCRVDRCPDRSWTLGANEYFMMGDNRNHSQDSRVFSSMVTRGIGESHSLP
jgi:signal peptidase I